MEKPIVDKINQILKDNEEKLFLDLSVIEILTDAKRVLLNKNNDFVLAYSDIIVMGVTVTQILALKHFYEMNTGKKAEDIV